MMIFRRRPASSCREASPLHSLWLLPLLILLLLALTPTAIGQSDDDDPCVESCCNCPNLESTVLLKNISSVNMLRRGNNCKRVQVIATMNDEKKRCLDPDSHVIRKLVLQILEGA